MRDPRSNPRVRLAIAGGCQWESLALISERVSWMPTLPVLCAVSRKHRWFAPVLVLALIADLYAPIRTAIAVLADEVLP